MRTAGALLVLLLGLVFLTGCPPGHLKPSPPKVKIG